MCDRLLNAHGAHEQAAAAEHAAAVPCMCTAEAHVADMLSSSDCAHVARVYVAIVLFFYITFYSLKRKYVCSTALTFRIFLSFAVLCECACFFPSFFHFFFVWGAWMSVWCGVP